MVWYSDSKTFGIKTKHIHHHHPHHNRNGHNHYEHHHASENDPELSESFIPAAVAAAAGVQRAETIQTPFVNFRGLLVQPVQAEFLNASGRPDLNSQFRDDYDKDDDMKQTSIHSGVYYDHHNLNNHHNYYHHNSCNNNYYHLHHNRHETSQQQQQQRRNELKFFQTKVYSVVLHRITSFVHDPFLNNLMKFNEQPQQKQNQIMIDVNNNRVGKQLTLENSKISKGLNFNLIENEQKNILEACMVSIHKSFGTSLHQFTSLHQQQIDKYDGIRLQGMIL